jgi:PhoPQ-activated pathogenicity-related protein
LSVEATPDQLIKAKLWTTSSATRDFRKSVWTSSDITINGKNKSEVQSILKYPKKDFQAFYIDLIYQNPKGGDYSVSTRTFVADKKQVFVK